MPQPHSFQAFSSAGQTQVLSRPEQGTTDGIDEIQSLPLYDLPFSDMTVRLDIQVDDYYYQHVNQEPGQTLLSRVDDVFLEDLDKLILILRNLPEKTGSLLHNEMQLRYQKFRTYNDQSWCEIRRYQNKLLTIDQLGIKHEAVRLIKAWNRFNGGLVLISGAPSVGKTTTAVHILKFFVETFGGKGLTLEDPCEYSLQGPHGPHGYIFQLQAHRTEWEKELQDFMRLNSRYIMLGEIRDPRTAYEALTASASGQLVISTIHAGSVDETVGRFASLATAANDQMSPKFIRQELAKSLIAIAHQKRSVYGPDLEILYAQNEQDRQRIADIIIDQKESAFSDTWVKRFRADRMR